jgi:hypothetical protein
MRGRDARLSAAAPKRLSVRYDSGADVVYITAEPAQDHLCSDRSAERVVEDIDKMLAHISRGEAFQAPCSSAKQAHDIMRRLEVLKNADALRYALRVSGGGPDTRLCFLCDARRDIRKLGSSGHRRNFCSASRNKN